MSGTRLNAALAVAVLLAGLALLPTTADRAFWVRLALMLAATVGIGAVLRALGAPDPVARLAQLAPGVAVVWWLWDEWPQLVAETAGYVATAYAPMPVHEGFRVLSMAVLWLLFVVAETIAVGLERPGWVFPLLVLPYLVTAIVLNEEASPVYLGLACAGYLLVLATAVYNRAEPQLTGGRRRLAGSIALTGAIVGMAAWTLSGLAAGAVPERGAALFDPSHVDSTVQLGDPTLDLVRNLSSPNAQQIISYTSSDGRGHYLRLAALPAFDRNGFHLVPTDLMPGLAEVTAGAGGPAVRLEVEVGDFGSEWLPVPWMPQSLDAAGDWRHDPATGAVVAVGSNRSLATRRLDYRVDSRLMQPGQPAIAAAAAGDAGDGGLTLALPDELDPRLIDLAREVTAGASTAGERVLALATWLRSDDFTYSTQIVEGSTLETVNDFLLNSRTGYCEQFAGSLAILARAVDVPSRVVIGFLPGTATETGYEVSTKDMHAWTEVLLDGLGWVSLDPTPSGAPEAEPIPSPSPTVAEPEVPEPTIDDVPTTSATPDAPTPTAPQPGSGFRLPGWIGWPVAAIAVALLPLALRRVRTARRLRPGAEPGRAAEDAWDELRDSLLDLGRPWPAGTPRQVAAELAAGLPADAAKQVTDLGLQVEQARFAPDAVAPVDPRSVRRIAAALPASSADRLLGRFLPRSVFRWDR